MSQHKNPGCDGFGNCYGDHCCYVNGSPCPYLQIDESITDPAQGRKYACGLYLELGSWKKVHADPRYADNVKPAWEARGTADCGDFMAGQMANTIRDGVMNGDYDPVCGCCVTRDLYSGE